MIFLAAIMLNLSCNELPVNLTVNTHLGAGFFAELAKVVAAIIHHENEGFSHINVNWTHEFFPYKDAPHENGWNLYFEPIKANAAFQSIAHKDIAVGHIYHELHDQICSSPWLSYEQFLPYRLFVHEIINRYIDLAVEGGDDHRQGADGGGVGAGHRLRLVQLVAAQRCGDGGGLDRDAAAAGPLERGGDLAGSQPRSRRRIRCRGQQLEGVGGGQVAEGLQRGGKVLAQRGAQPQQVTAAFPDQRLMGAGGHLDRLGPVTVTGHRPQLVGIGAHHVGQRVRVALIAFRPRSAVPFPVPGHLARVDRVDGITGRAQRRHPQAPVGLDADRHLTGLSVRAGKLADQGVQPGDPGDPLRQPRPCQHPALLILHLDVVMIFRPVIPDEQHTSLPFDPSPQLTARQREENTNGLMDSAHASGGHDTPSVVLLSSRPARARSLLRA